MYEQLFRTKPCEDPGAELRRIVRDLVMTGFRIQSLGHDQAVLTKPACKNAVLSIDNVRLSIHENSIEARYDRVTPWEMITSKAMIIPGAAPVIIVCYYSLLLGVFDTDSPNRDESGFSPIVSPFLLILLVMGVSLMFSAIHIYESNRQFQKQLTPGY